MPISGRRRRLGALARKAAVAMLVVAGAGSAAARGVAVDTVLPNAVTGCTLGASCSPSNLGGAYDLGNYFGATPVSAFTTGPFSNIYIYADGVISIGAPLPSTASVAGGLASLGSGNYIAAGLGDYSALDEQVLVSVLPAPEAPGPDISPEELRIYWTFDLPAGQTTLDPTGGQNAIFGIDMMYEGGGKYLVDVNYGASTSSWYSKSIHGHPIHRQLVLRPDLRPIGGGQPWSLRRRFRHRRVPAQWDRHRVELSRRRRPGDRQRRLPLPRLHVHHRRGERGSRAGDLGAGDLGPRRCRMAPSPTRRPTAVRLTVKSRRPSA